MRMGNFMCLGCIPRIVMAVKESRMGIRHVTVVPTNFEPAPDPENGRDEDEE